MQRTWTLAFLRQQQQQQQQQHGIPTSSGGVSPSPALGASLASGTERLADYSKTLAERLLLLPIMM